MKLTDQLLANTQETDFAPPVVLVPIQKTSEKPCILSKLQPSVLVATLLLDQWKTEGKLLSQLIDQGRNHRWPEQTHLICQRFESCLKQDMRRMEEAVSLLEKDITIATMGKKPSSTSLTVKMEDLRQKMANFQHKYLDLKNELLTELVQEHPATFF